MYAADEEDLNALRKDLLMDFLLFHRVMFEKRTGRPFMISQPIGNESHFITFARELTDVFLGLTKRIYIGCPPGWAKAIDIDTPILTIDGWKIAKEIVVGDELIGTNGWTKVVGVHPQGIVEAKEIIFSDHTSLVCNDDHQWGVYNRETPTDLKTLTTKKISSLYP